MIYICVYVYIHTHTLYITFSNTKVNGFRPYFCLKPQLSLWLFAFINLPLTFKLHFHLKNIMVNLFAPALVVVVVYIK